MLPFSANCGRKGNVKRETKRNTLLLKLTRSGKGNVNQVTLMNSLPPNLRNNYCYSFRLWRTALFIYFTAELFVLIMKSVN